MKPVSWAESIERFLAAREAAGLARSTLQIYAATLTVFSAFVRKAGVTAPRDLRRHHLEAWHDYLITDYRVRSSASSRRRLVATGVYAWVSMVIKLARFLVAHELLLADPVAGLERPRYRRSRRRFIPTVDEVQRFLETIQDPDDVYAVRDRALFELLYSSGLRAGEAAGLDLYDLDLTAGLVRVRHGKGGYDRVVPVGATAIEHLNRYVRDARPETWTPRAGEALFTARWGGRLRNCTVSTRCRGWAARAGLPLLKPHSLRHAVATHLLAAGADVRFIQALLGHHHITTTNLYTHLVVTDLVQAHARCHPRG